MNRFLLAAPLGLFGILFTLLTWTTVGSAANWPQFRGPTGLGYTDEKSLPVTWGGPANENVRWQAPLRGQGHASPVVWSNLVFVCTAYWPSNITAREKVIPEHHVTCYQVEDGKALWDTLVPPGPWLRTDFRSGPGGGYAAPTPATDGRLLYCAFGSAVLAALDFQGQIVWRKEIVPYTFDVTLGSSPILYQDTVILFCAMATARDSCLLAYNKASGELKWREKLPDMTFGHSTPVIIEVDHKPQMLLLASGMGVKTNALRSLDPATGKLLWWCRGAGDAASPAYRAGLVYSDSGRGGPGFAVDARGSGDVSQTHLRWTVGQVPEGIGSPIIVGDHVYRLHTPGILKCWETATGKQVYAERLEGLSTTWASPIADGNGRLYFANAGKSHVIQTGPEFRLLAVNELGDGNHASPAVADGRLFLVGSKNLYCVEQPRPAASQSEATATSAGLAAHYPADVGIEKDPRVLFAENFETGTVEELGKRWTQISNKDGKVIAFSNDVPPGSAGQRSLQLTATLGENTGGHLYQRLRQEVDKVFARFYVRFAADAPYLHHFVTVGGYRPGTDWPQGGAGERPRGDDRFTAGIEPYGNYGRFPAPGAWNFYAYWPEMKGSADGRYWGNSLTPEQPALVPRDTWQCVEVMLQCNSAPDKADGQLALWLDGKPVMHFTPGARRNRWTGMGFSLLKEGGEPFEGFRWRSNDQLKINFFWLLHYVTDNAARQNRVAKPNPIHRVWFDHIVVSREYVGPIQR